MDTVQGSDRKERFRHLLSATHTRFVSARRLLRSSRVQVVAHARCPAVVRWYVTSTHTRTRTHARMLAVPVCIYVLSLSTCKHLYTFMYPPPLSPHPIYHTPKSHAYNVNNDNSGACACTHTHTHTHACTCMRALTHMHTHNSYD